MPLGASALPGLRSSGAALAHTVACAGFAIRRPPHAAPLLASHHIQGAIPGSPNRAGYDVARIPRRPTGGSVCYPVPHPMPRPIRCLARATSNAYVWLQTSGVFCGILGVMVNQPASVPMAFTSWGARGVRVSRLRTDPDTSLRADTHHGSGGDNTDHGHLSASCMMKDSALRDKSPSPSARCSNR